MQYKNILVIVGLAALSTVVAQEFDNNDVPSVCRSLCDTWVTAARTCDEQLDNDRQEVDCICNTPGADTSLAECAACVRTYASDDDDDEDDVEEVVRSCGFSTTTFQSYSATVRNGPVSSLQTVSRITSETASSKLTTTLAIAPTQTSVPQIGGAVDSVTNSGGSVVNAATSSAGEATSAAGDAVTDSGAVAIGLQMLGAGAGALAAVLGLL